MERSNEPDTVLKVAMVVKVGGYDDSGERYFEKLKWDWSVDGGGQFNRRWRWSSSSQTRYEDVTVLSQISEVHCTLYKWCVSVTKA